MYWQFAAQQYYARMTEWNKRKKYDLSTLQYEKNSTQNVFSID